MSPAIKRTRKVLNPPAIKGFKPYGPETGSIHAEPVYLLLEEYEAIRLSDYDGLNHHKASLMMDVSRPTFTRIYASALRKMATALVEGRQVAIEGGKIYFDSDWYHCMGCHCFFNNPEKETVIEKCPLCGYRQYEKYSPDELLVGEEPEMDICYCQACGHTHRHRHGHQCNGQICPECGSWMKRKGTPDCKSLKHKQ